MSQCTALGLKSKPDGCGLWTPGPEFTECRSQFPDFDADTGKNDFLNSFKIFSITFLDFQSQTIFPHLRYSYFVIQKLKGRRHVYNISKAIGYINFLCEFQMFDSEALRR